MSHAFRLCAALVFLLLLIAVSGDAAPFEPEAILDVVVEDVESAPAGLSGLSAVDHLVTVERVLQGSVPGTSLIVRVPATQLTALQPGAHAVLALAPAHDGSFRLLRVVRERPAAGAPAAVPEPAAPPGMTLAAFFKERMYLDDGSAEGSFGPFPGQEPETGGSAAAKIVTGLFEGNGFVSMMAVLNLEGVGGSVSVLLRDVEGEPVGNPAVLTLGPRMLGLQPLSRMFPELVSRRGPFTVQLLSNGILFAASALLLEIESQDQIFIPATLVEAGAAASSGEMFFPRVVRDRSPFDTFLTSRLVAFNPAREGRLLTVELWERGQDNTAPRTAFRYVEPGQAFRTDDVLLDLFGVEEGIGALHVSWSGPAGPAPLVVSLQLAGAADGQGKRFGALVDRATAAEAIHSRGIDVGAGQTAETRSSFGLLNLASASTNLRLTLKDAAGQPLGSNRIDLKPRQHLERNVAGLFPGIGFPGGNGDSWSIETEVVSGGPILTYLAQIDASGDISYVPGHAR
jgi:hypothetical protein